MSIAASTAPLPLDVASAVFLGARLRELREGAGLSQLEAAETVLGYNGSHAAVSRAERGIPRYLKGDIVESLAKAYGTTLEQLLSDTLYDPASAAKNISTAHETSTDNLNIDGMELMPGFGERMHTSRCAAKVSLTELARKLGWEDTGRALLRDYERERHTPRKGTLIKIAVVLGMPAAYLINGKRIKSTRPSMAMRGMAARLVAGLSRKDVALAAFPEGPDDVAYRATVHLESKGSMPPQRLEAIARALDVPAEWLDPRRAEVYPMRARLVGNQVIAAPQAQAVWDQEQRLPSQVRRLLGELRELACAELLTDQAMREVRKALYSGLMVHNAGKTGRPKKSA